MNLSAATNTQAVRALADTEIEAVTGAQNEKIAAQIVNDMWYTIGYVKEAICIGQGPLVCMP